MSEVAKHHEEHHVVDDKKTVNGHTTHEHHETHDQKDVKENHDTHGHEAANENKDSWWKLIKDISKSVAKVVEKRVDKALGDDDHGHGHDAHGHGGDHGHATHPAANDNHHTEVHTHHEVHVTPEIAAFEESVIDVKKLIYQLQLDHKLSDPTAESIIQKLEQTVKDVKAHPGKLAEVKKVLDGIKHDLENTAKGAKTDAKPAHAEPAKHAA